MKNDQLHEFARLRANLNDPKFPDLMLHVVVETIKQNPSITLNALCFHLCDCLFYPKNRVTSAVGVLTSTYECVQRRNVPTANKRVTHLSYTGNAKFEEWHKSLVEATPCLLTFVAPQHSQARGARRTGEA